MAITRVKIHPAIGIARVGNSPDEFFVGPERLWDPPRPAGGFKDEQGRYRCRVRASGRSAKGYPIQREHTLTVPVWHGAAA